MPPRLDGLLDEEEFLEDEEEESFGGDMIESNRYLPPARGEIDSVEHIVRRIDWGNFPGL